MRSFKPGQHRDNQRRKIGTYCQRIAASALLFFVIPTISFAQATLDPSEKRTPIGEIVRGVSAYWDKYGNIQYKSGAVLWLDDGREIHLNGDRWTLVTANDVPVEEVIPTDLALYGERYSGRRIQVNGAVLMTVNVKQGTLKVPGANIPIFFKGTDRESLRYFVEHCATIFANFECIAKITATVLRANSRNGDIALDEPVIAR